ncbi:unnamed protein product [Rotaria socialis]
MAYMQNQQYQQSAGLPEINLNEYSGRNVDDVVNELEALGKSLGDKSHVYSHKITLRFYFYLGYRTQIFDANLLIRAQPLPQVPNEETLHIYVNKDRNTVQQITRKY